MSSLGWTTASSADEGLADLQGPVGEPRFRRRRRADRGGRWNHRGDRMVYTADSLALAALETFVHVDPALVPDDLVAVSASIPDDASVVRLEDADLPRDWNRMPAPNEVKDLGSEWIRGRKSLLLVVSSAIIPVERCVLINPAHPEFARVEVHEPLPFTFDGRLWKS
nr:RES family NAD+ phosphorylase [Vulgatibacter incomptus]